ncbi:activator-dependent family glycosyltransferase [Streptomyces tendae]
MRVLFTVFAVKTHLYNLVPLAWALEAAGHEVRVASQPDLTEAITRSGLTAVPVGEELNMGGSSRGPTSQTFQGLSGGMTDYGTAGPSWEEALGAFTVACPVQYEFFSGQSMVDDLVEFAGRWRPDLVIWDALTFAGPVVALSCGAAHARLLFGMDYISRMYGFYTELLRRQPPQHREDPVAEWLRGRLSRHGIAFDEDSATELMTGQWTIDPTPPWMQFSLDLRYLPVRHVPHNGPTGIPDWIHTERGRPRVCLSLGTSGRELLGGDVVSATDLLETLSGFDVEVIATFNAEQLSSVPVLPANVRLVDFVPLNELLPTCAAIVHHGGFGTVGNVLAHGVPSLTVPAPWWDEADLGRHLADAGAGLVIEPAALTVEALASGLTRLLDEPSFTANAARLRTRLQDVPSPNDLVPELVRLTERHRAPAGA